MQRKRESTSQIEFNLFEVRHLKSAFETRAKSIFFSSLKLKPPVCGGQWKPESELESKLDRNTNRSRGKFGDTATPQLNGSAMQ